MNIQWYPGHMTKTRRKMEEDIKLVDAVCEIVDARIPSSSRNPDLEAMLGEKPRLVVLNRADQADPEITKLWRQELSGAIETSAGLPGGVREFEPAVKRLLAEKLARFAEKGQHGRGLKLMICGVPNVGKSTLINALAGRRAAKAEDRPGVTRGMQWITVGNGLTALDTPGILWPKFGDELTGLHLAYTGAIRDQIMDTETLAMKLMEELAALKPDALAGRYKIAPEGAGHEMLEAAAKKRGFLIAGGELDTERMAIILLDELRAGKLGRISLERP